MKDTKAKIYFTKLDFDKLSNVGNRYKIALNSIPQFRREKIFQYTNQEDKFRSFYAWKLLEKAVQIEFSFGLEKEVINFNSCGKPYLENKNNLHFNLSHSGEIVACVVDVFPVGIDVEEVSPIDISIATSFFSERENFDLFSLPQNEQINYFYKLWTLKESYIKAEGEGLSIPLNSFAFKAGSDGINFEGKNSRNWDFLLHDINTNSPKNYCLGFCIRKGRVPNKIIEIPYDLFL